jgi:uncharacterized protein YuzE
MRIEGRYDAEADIAWVRFEGYDPSTAVGEQTDSGLRELAPTTGEIVGLEFWQASQAAAGGVPADASSAAGRDRGLTSMGWLRPTAPATGSGFQ